MIIEGKIHHSILIESNINASILFEGVQYVPNQQYNGNIYLPTQ